MFSGRSPFNLQAEVPSFNKTPDDKDVVDASQLNRIHNYFVYVHSRAQARDWTMGGQEGSIKHGTMHGLGRFSS